MKKTTIITIVAFALGIIILAVGFVLLTDNNISKSIFTTTTTTTTAPDNGEPAPTPDYKPMDLMNEDLSKYVTLGQYKGVEVEVDQVKVSEADIDFEIHIIMCQKDLHSKQLSGKTTEKVIFNFDFTGYLLKEDGTRGEKFEGGSATNYFAYIDGNDFRTVSSSGIGGFIDGFAQGMLGMSVGETKSLDITFPADYHSAEMAGKKVEFEVKVNYIAKTDFTNDTASYISDGKYKTVKEYRSYLAEEANAQLASLNQQYIWSTVIGNATFIEIPAQEVDYWYYTYASDLESYASMMGMNLDDFLKAGYGGYFGINAYSVDELKNMMIELVKEELVMYSIMKAEQLEMSEEEYQEALEELAAELQTTAEKLYEDYTEDFIRDYLKQRVLMNKVTDLVLTQNVCVEKK